MTAANGMPSSATHEDVSNASVGELIGEVSRDLSTLMRQELELAKVEIKTEVTKSGKAAGMLGGAGFAGYMVMLFLSCALWWGLERDGCRMGRADRRRPVGRHRAVLYASGRKTLRTVNPKPERAVDTVQEIPGALKGH